MTINKEMALPTIHTGGTSRNQLLESYKESMTALRKAENVLQENGPNARDYYIQGAEAFPQAVRDHEERIQKLRSVREELQAIAESILSQGRAR